MPKATDDDLKKIQDALTRTGEAVYRNRVIKAGANGYSVTGFDGHFTFWTGAVRAIDVEDSKSPKEILAPMTLNEAAHHLDFYLRELRNNHESVLRLILREFAATTVTEELVLFDRAATAIHNLAHTGKALFEVDPEKGCDVQFIAKIPPTQGEDK